ncbi:ATP-binding protein [Mesorhizobium sp. M0130]|uniref:ATP-binding protein n=1 Tax=Mesorhizobium sp. M0130 TaxID=2956887 RepID=UPI003335FFE8
MVDLAPEDVGKSWLACALGYKACREDLGRVSPRAAPLRLARPCPRRRPLRTAQEPSQTDLLILDDCGPEELNEEQRRDLLKIPR